MNTNSVAPTSVTASVNPVCPGSSTTLTVNGGSLGTGASWQWYSGSCGGTSVGSGSSISVNPGSATTYYALASGTCNTTTCASLTVNVNTNSVAPSSVSASVNPVCPGSPTTLTVNGGSLGTGAGWQWYSGSCGGTSVGSGSSISVSPGSSTTYYVLASGTCNTTGCASLTVNTNTLSVAPLSVSATVNPICSGSPSVLSVNGGSLGTNASWMWYSGSCGGSYVGTGSSIAVSPTATTSYFVLAQGDCNTTLCASVSLNVTPVSVDAGTDQTICSGESTNLTATGTGSFTWSYMGLTTPTINVTPTATTTYTVTANNAGCIASDAVTVNVTSAADAGILSTGPYCSGQSPLNLTAVDPGGTWTGTGITNASLGTFSPASAGVGTHQIIYTITGSCGDADTVNISVIASADASITPAGPFCTNDQPVNLQAAESGGLWSGTGITNSTAGTFSPAVSGAGTFNIIYSISGTCGNADTASVTVNLSANAAINSAGPFCVTEPALNLTAVQAGGTWSGTGITDANNGTFDPAVAGLGTHLITYILAGICPDTGTLSITISNSFDASIDPAGPYCSNDAAVILTAADAGGSWSGQGITNSSTGQFNPATAGAGTFDIVYTITGSCGDTDTLSITVNPAYDASITAAGPYCEGDPAVNLSAVSSGGIWSGTGITDVNAGTFDPAVAGTGTHIITYMISGSCGDTASINITVNTSADASINAAGPFCSNDAPFNLSAATPGGAWSGQGITNTSTGQFSPASVGAGSYDVVYTIGGSCGDTDTLTIIVNAAHNATINPAGPYCETANAVFLTAAESGGTWSGTGITNGSTGAFDPQVAGPGSHVIIYSISGTCPDSDTLTITVIPLANTEILSTGPYCNNLAPFNLSAATSGGIWSGAGITNTSSGSFNPAMAGVGTHSIIYLITGNCGNSDTVSIAVLPSPSATVAGTHESCQGAGDGTAQITGTGGTAPYTYLWENGAGTSSVSALLPGSYTVILTDANGCFVTDTVVIQESLEPCEVVIPVIYVPNIFSPNGDGENDWLYVRGQGVTSLDFKVYNRWGELVFETSELGIGWDGTYKGQLLDNAVFVYYLSATFYTGDEVKKKGNITLSR